MSAELDLSPPEVPEPTLLESLLRYGLFLGAIFQLICILAIIIPSSKTHEQESEAGDGKPAEPNKKAKGPAPQIRQKLKKESKKKR
ncbi:protein MANBAL [Hypomesus transpacificus]|uniref:protein MANBAL n=1 Tax=Hypomesus transpacificus TaxID=137520 RepID=UPI001F07C5B3|nr:protein MANBAL [Hypomesus transpacificus]